MVQNSVKKNTYTQFNALVGPNAAAGLILHADLPGPQRSLLLQGSIEGRRQQRMSTPMTHFNDVCINNYCMTRRLPASQWRTSSKSSPE